MLGQGEAQIFVFFIKYLHKYSEIYACNAIESELKLTYGAMDLHTDKTYITISCIVKDGLYLASMLILVDNANRASKENHCNAWIDVCTLEKNFDLRTRKSENLALLLDVPDI